MFALGGLGPNIVTFAQAKAAGYKAFEVIDKESPIKLDNPEAKSHPMEGQIEFNRVSFSYPTRKEQFTSIDSFSNFFSRHIINLYFLLKVK